MRSSDFVSAARSYIGTPFHHQGRIPHVGMDCAGVVVCAANSCGYEINDFMAYSKIPAIGLLESAINHHCDVIQIDNIRSGDLMIFKFKNNPQHLAIFDSEMIIHSYSPIGVVVNNFDLFWQERLVGCFRLKGID